MDIQQKTIEVTVVQPTDEWGWLEWLLPGVIIPVALAVLTLWRSRRS